MGTFAFHHKPCLSRYTKNKEERTTIEVAKMSTERGGKTSEIQSEATGSYSEPEQPLWSPHPHHLIHPWGSLPPYLQPVSKLQKCPAPEAKGTLLSRQALNSVAHLLLRIPPKHAQLRIADDNVHGAGSRPPQDPPHHA